MFPYNGQKPNFHENDKTDLFSYTRHCNSFYLLRFYLHRIIIIYVTRQKRLIKNVETNKKQNRLLYGRLP